MAFQLSPGVLVREQDATAVVPAVGTTVGGFVGDFAWGPARELVSVSGENNLVARFGKPRRTNNVDFLTASSFLAYGSNLLVSREVGSTARNAVSVTSKQVSTAGITITAGGSGYTSAPTVTIAAPTGVSPANGGITATATATIVGGAVTGITITNQGFGYTVAPNVTFTGGGGSGASASVVLDSANQGKLIRNDDDYDATYAGESNGVGPFAAKFPGKLGDSLKVSVADLGNFTANAVSQTITIDAGGSGYTSAPTVSFAASPRTGGTANAYATLNSGAVESVVLIYPGFGYTSAPAITFSGGGGSGAQATATLTTEWIYAGQFDNVPGTSDWADSNGINFDELHVIVIDEGGEITGTAGTVLEKYEGLSKVQGAKSDDNSANYYKDAINARSNWIRFTDQVPTNSVFIGTSWGQDLATTQANTDISGSFSQPYPKLLGSSDTNAWSFNGGVDAAPTDGDLQTSYAKFANDEETDVSLIIAGGHSATVGDYIIDNVSEIRKDCLTFVSPARASVVNNSGSEVTDIKAELASYTRSSYAVMDSGWKYMYDRYNDIYAWVPVNGDTAGCCVTADLEADPWFSPAGVNRGSIKNAVKLAFNPTKADRDALYSAGVNPIVQNAQQGIILFGDKTLLAKTSAFNRINVRRLFIVIEKAVAAAAKFQLFEFNDAFTRAQFRSLVEPFLRDVQGRRGVYDFRVVCDETNNTGQVIDANEFRADIFIKPAKSINFITLTFVATRTGISFEELGA
jgi:hypothetical protein